MTSSDAVVLVRRRLPRGTKVGHAGTLDPEACGVLPVMVGKATRLFDYLVEKEKIYIAQLKTGIETDTQDAYGKVLSRSENEFLPRSSRTCCQIFWARFCRSRRCIRR